MCAQIADFVRSGGSLFSLTLRKIGISTADEGCCDRLRDAFLLGDAASSIKYRPPVKLLQETVGLKCNEQILVRSGEIHPAKFL